MQLNSHEHSPSTHKWSQHFLWQSPKEQAGCIWIHACSVGEVASILPLIQALHAQHHRIHLTVVTRTGFAHAQKHVGSMVSISYLPWDLPTLMRRFVRQLKPKLLLLTETEFWPGMLKACHRQGVKVLGINTRISDRSFPKYHATRFFWRHCLKHVNQFFPQSKVDGERLIAMGVDAECIQVVGNLKYAVQTPDVDASKLRQRIDASGLRPIVLVASTHEDEEQRIMAMWQTWHRQQPNLLLIVVPRHPERFDSVADMIQEQGIPLARWSNNDAIQHADVLLIDAMGILQGLYTIADIAVIGGSLVNIGGHNPLEAAVCGRGVLTGPYVHNFRQVMEDMQKASAAIVSHDDAELESVVLDMLKSPEALRQLNAHAALFMQTNTQVLENMLVAIHPYL